MRARMARACMDFGPSAILFNFSRSWSVIWIGFFGRQVRTQRYASITVDLFNVFPAQDTRSGHQPVELATAALSRTQPGSPFPQQRRRQRTQTQGDTGSVRSGN